MANDALIIYLYFPPPPNFLVEWEGGRKRNKCMEVLKEHCKAWRQCTKRGYNKLAAATLQLLPIVAVKPASSI